MPQKLEVGMRKLLILTLSAICFFTACEQEQASKGTLAENSVQEIRQEDGASIADIIRNPVTANGPVDTINVAKMVFEETTHRFGEVKEGALIEHVFSFTNTGKIPLIINDARSTCGCTVPEWPKAPIAAGESGEIKVKFKTDKKKGRQNKPVTITANTYPQKTVLYMQGVVLEKK